jgi:hypothetical protein
VKNSPPTHAASNAIAAFLDGVRLAPRQSVKQLTLWPLILHSGATSGLAYAPLARALDEGWVQLDEVTDAGSVRHARVRNRGSLAVLVLFGEELRGAKQNRVANATFLVGPGQDLVLDVSCVEQGRWGRAPIAPGFESTGSLVSHALRKKMARQVHESRRRGLSFAADQGEVWEGISERIRYARTASPTNAYQDYVDARSSDLAEIRRALRAVGGQVGFVAMVGERVVGIEAIGRPEPFAECFARLVDSYAIDAVDAAVAGDEWAGEEFREPEPFLLALRSAPLDASPSLGVGVDLRIASDRVEGCALDAGGLVHLTAAPATSAGGSHPFGPARPFPG